MASWPALAKADTQGGFAARPSPSAGSVLSSAGRAVAERRVPRSLWFLAQKLSKGQSWSWPVTRLWGNMD